MKLIPTPFPHAFKIVLVCCAITISGLSIPINCGGLFCKPAADSLNAGMGALTFYLTIQYVVTALFLPVAGRLMAGPMARRTLLAAIALDAIAFSSLGVAQHVWQFYLAGLAMGFAGAILIFLAVPVLITNWFASSTGAALGAALAAGGIASALLSPPISLLINSLGWRLAYLICGCGMALIALPPCLFMAVMKPADIGLKPWGTASTGAEQSGDGAPLPACLRSAVFWMVFLFAGLLGVTSALIIHIPPYMLELGHSPLSVSSILSISVIGVTCGMFGIGWLNDRIGMGFAVSLGALLGLLGMFLLFLGGSHVTALAGGFCYGAGSATTLVAPPLVVQKLFGMRDYARIYAWITTAVALGAALGVSLFGFARDFANNYAAALILAMLLQTVALLLFALSIALRGKAKALWR